jgi:hypothetical protein
MSCVTCLCLECQKLGTICSYCEISCPTMGLIEICEYFEEGIEEK